MLRVDDDNAAARSLEHVAIAQDGKARIEGDVPVTTKENAENGGERLDAPAREDSAELRAAAARISFQQQTGDPECAAVQLVIRESYTRHLDGGSFGKGKRGAEKAQRERCVFPWRSQAGARRDACSNATAACWSSSSSGGMSRMNVSNPSSM